MFWMIDDRHSWKLHLDFLIKCNVSVFSLVNLMDTTVQKMKPAREIWMILLTNQLLKRQAAPMLLLYHSLALLAVLVSLFSTAPGDSLQALIHCCSMGALYSQGQEQGSSSMG